MKICWYISTMASLLQVIGAFAQDSAKYLSPQQVVEIVMRYHPVAKQADLVEEKAKADLTAVRGMFDPILQSQIAQKTFDGTDYYYYSRPEIVIPTWFGIEIRSGLEYLSGTRTDPVETKGETSYFGISVPLAKNLLMDKRRAALQTAKILRDASLAEKRAMLNNLLLDAMKSYWDWAQQYYVYQILSDAVMVNIKRVQFVKTAYNLGDRPAIDTTEAITQLENFELLKNQAWLEFQNAGLELSVYLWTAQSEPYLLPETVVPEPDLQTINIGASVLPELNGLLESAKKNHPDLVIYNYKLNVLDIEKKLKLQELLPVVNFKYNQLGKGYDVLKTVSGPLLENNYQYGIFLGIPLRLSAGRGEFRKAKLEISETQLQRNQKQLVIENKIKGYYNELVTLKKQAVIQEQMYGNILMLQRGEETRFQAGESSLFLINAREIKTLETAQKLIQLKAKYYKTEIALLWSAGMPVQ